MLTSQASLFRVKLQKITSFFVIQYRYHLFTVGCAMDLNKTARRKTNTIELLKQIVERCYQEVDFYRTTLKPHLRDNNTITDIQGFETLPYTTKEDVKKSFPFGMLGMPLAKMIAYYESSGSTATDGNKSTKSASFLSKKDLLRDIERRLMNDIKVDENDVILNALPYAYTSCGLAFHRAFQEQGAMIVACNNTNTYSNFSKQIDLDFYLKPTILLSAYPFAYNFLADKKTDSSFVNLKSVVLCGLPTSEQGKNKISSIFNNANIYDIYGLSEFGAVTACCSFGKKHIIETDFYLEIIDSDSGLNVTGTGSGEIVITTLTREGSPKIRYKTGDFGKVTYETCICGNNSPTIEIKGRITDAIIIGGKKLFPTDFEGVICSAQETNGIFKATIKRGGIEEMPIVEAEVTFCNNKKSIERWLEKKFLEELSVDVTLLCKESGTLYPNALFNQNSTSFKTIKSFHYE
jgi:phenylacetate-CoA ligase